MSEQETILRAALGNGAKTVAGPSAEAMLLQEIVQSLKVLNESMKSMQDSLIDMRTNGVKVKWLK